MSGFGPSSQSYPNQSPYFSGLQQLIASGSMPGSMAGSAPWPGVKAPNVSPIYTPSLFTPSSATRADAFRDPSSIANPFATPPGPAPGGPGTPPTPYGKSIASTAGMDPSTILSIMMRGGFDGGSAPMAGKVTPSGYTQGADDPTVGKAVPSDATGALTSNPMQGISEWLQQIFNPGNEGPPGTAIAPLPGLDVARAGTAVIDPTKVSATDQLGKGYDFTSLMKMLTDSSANELAAGNTVQAGAGSGRELSDSATIDRTGENVQTLDQILGNVTGGNSDFVNRIMPAFRNAFDASNAETAATAKESAGNLTGSGFANTLGAALNRNRAPQDQLLATTITGLGQTELQRQQAAAALAAGQNTAQAQMKLSAATTSANLAAQAQALALQARASGRSDLMQQAQMLMSQATQQAALEQGANNLNAGAENTANENYFNAGVNRNNTQAGMDAARFSTQFGAANAQSSQNASQFMQLLQMLFGGGQSSTTTSSGAMAAFPALMQLLGTLVTHTPPV